MLVRVRIGISGWTYKPWRGVFYPPKLAPKLALQFASSQFESIEINSTFFGLQRPSSFERWAAEHQLTRCSSGTPTRSEQNHY